MINMSFSSREVEAKDSGLQDNQQNKFQTNKQNNLRKQLRIGACFFV